MDGSSKQKKRFSRAWTVSVAKAANFTYEIVAEDECDVDMTVHSNEHTLGFQLKATSNRDGQDGCHIHGLCVRTYNLHAASPSIMLPRRLCARTGMTLTS